MSKKSSVTVTKTKAELEQDIRNLEASLISGSSDIGDWKIAKCQEYALAGLDLPYDIQELHNARQAVRDEINTIQEQIDNMPDEEVTEA